MGEGRSVRVLIAGRVQGVGYRAWTERQARARGLAGHVRNRDDGGVEAVFHGEAGAIEAMIEACRTGPAGARVSEVVVEAAPAPGGAGFGIRYE